MNEPAHAPELSVVVAIVSDTTDTERDLSHLAGCLQALCLQKDAPALEIIVPYLAGEHSIQELTDRFPDVVFIPCENVRTYTGQGGSREHHDELRARGLEAAKGRLLGLLEDHARPAPGWAAAMIRAHEHPYAAVGGAIENGLDHPLNWAVYFCDFGKYQNPVKEGESWFASDANVSYKREALEGVRSTWQEIFHETNVNWALMARGEKLALATEAIVYQYRSNLRFLAALKERFIWGRSYAATRGKMAGGLKRLVYAVLSPLLPAVLLSRMARTVFGKRRCIGAFLKALPITVLLTTAWSIGEFVGYLTGRAGQSTEPAHRKLALVKTNTR